MKNLLPHFIKHYELSIKHYELSINGYDYKNI